ncbi:LysM peptidoglycan-binding domain-containing protein [Archangium gephyra]|uniref:LysM peptidoglycan-binding domain-containing protein n=1 Tax=Archangium gephyra TaxID=48 RepID=UPI003B7CE474
MAHKIRPGETLSGIAQRYGTTVSALARANNIANPNVIRAGATLNIPGRSDSFAAPSGGGGRHVVRAGETLSGIAGRYGTTVSALARANNIANPNMIRAGATLSIPGRSGGSPAPSRPAPSGPGQVSNSPGQFGSRAQHLANVARGVASQMNTRGWCARGVFNSLQAAGMAIPRSPSAYMAAATLARDPRFREVNLSDAQIRALPPGAIVVSGAYNSPGNPHGHIAVTLGNGMEASDHIARIATHGTQRVFIPR